MTDDERKAAIVEVCNKLGLPPDEDEGPYEADTTEETDTTKQGAASTPKDVIDIDIDDDNYNDDKDEDDINADTNYDGDAEDNNTLHPRTARKQVCEEREEESLFSEDSDGDHDEHDSESSDDKSKNNKKSRRTPKKTHWSGNGLPAAQEAAAVSR